MIEYTGPMQFSSEVAGSQTFLGSNAPVYTENTSLDDLLKLQELYSSKSSGSIFNPRGRVYSNLKEFSDDPINQIEMLKKNIIRRCL